MNLATTPALRDRNRRVFWRCTGCGDEHRDDGAFLVSDMVAFQEMPDADAPLPATVTRRCARCGPPGSFYEQSKHPRRVLFVDIDLGAKRRRWKKVGA